MLWAFLVAAVAVAIAMTTAVVNASRATQLKTDLKDQIEQSDAAINALRKQVSEAYKKFACAQAQAQVSREEYDKTTAELVPWAHAQLSAVDDDLGDSTELLRELQHFAICSLEHDAAFRADSCILRGALYTRQPELLDVGNAVMAGLVTAFNAKVIYRTAAEPYGCEFYLRWNSGAARDELASVLDNTCASGPNGNGELHADGLAVLLHALSGSGAAVVHVGPLVVVRSATEMAAGIAKIGWLGLTKAQKATLSTGISTELLHGQEIGASHMANLTDWLAP